MSAAGIMSGLATAGGGVSLLLGGVVSASVAGIFVMTAPITILAVGGIGVAKHLKNKQLQQQKEEIYEELVILKEKITQAVEDETNSDSERVEYLYSLQVLLSQGEKELGSDIGVKG